MPQSVQEKILSQSLGHVFSAIPQAAGCRKRRSSDPVKKEARNISVSFVKREHGDPFPFDGVGGTIGHVIFPRGNTSKYRKEICQRTLSGDRINISLHSTRKYARIFLN